MHQQRFFDKARAVAVLACGGMLLAAGATALAVGPAGASAPAASADGGTGASAGTNVSPSFAQSNGLRSLLNRMAHPGASSAGAPSSSVTTGGNAVSPQISEAIYTGGWILRTGDGQIVRTTPPKDVTASASSTGSTVSVRFVQNQGTVATTLKFGVPARATPTTNTEYETTAGSSIAVTGTFCSGAFEYTQITEAPTTHTLTSVGVEFDAFCNNGYVAFGELAWQLTDQLGVGYYLYDLYGTIQGYGNNQLLTYFGALTTYTLNAPIIDMAVMPTGLGYWMGGSDGGIFAFGNAPYKGSMGGKPLNAPIVGMAADPAGNGYWEVGSDGGIFAFGTAPYKGSRGGQPLNKPIVGIAASPTTSGYWLVAADGGIFAYTAPYYGSTGTLKLNAPIVGMSSLPTGKGYRFVASDGGIFDFGTAKFDGSRGGQPLNKPIVGMATTPTGKGYWLVAGDGGIFAYTAPFDGTIAGTIGLTTPSFIVGIIATDQRLVV